MNCKNCGATVQDNYCGHCGQKATVGKLTTAQVGQELFNNLLQIDHGFWYTCKELFVRPGASIREYLQGQRVKHVKPITYVLALWTIYFVLSRLTDQNTWMDDILNGWLRHEDGETESSRSTQVMIWFSKNLTYTTLLLLPVFSLASYLSFLRAGWNYMEHFVLNTYITGQQAILYLLIMLLNTIEGLPRILDFSGFLAFGYTIWVYRQFFPKHHWALLLLRIGLIFLLYLLFSLGLLALVLIANEITQTLSSRW